MIGLCCHYLVPNNKSTKYDNVLNEKTLQLGRFNENKYSESFVKELLVNNVKNLHNLLFRIKKEGYGSYRMSSGLIPLWDKVGSEALNNNELNEAFTATGQFIKNNDLRITTHPDQFVVLSSDNPNVIKNSITILNQHAWVMDKLSLPHTQYYSINIHGGKKGNHQTLIQSINQLPSNVKDRLTLENDESSYSVRDLYEVWSHTGVPITFDSHHHTFNDGGLSSEAAMQLAISTWKEKPMTHLSNTEPGMEGKSFKDRRKHSNYVHYNPSHQMNANNSGQIDIEFEFKMKNIAIKKAVLDFGIKL